MRRLGRLAASLLAISLLTLGGAAIVSAQQPGDVEVESPFRGVEVDHADDRVDLELLVHNRADERRAVRFVVEGVPEGWDIAVWNTLFRYRMVEFVVRPAEAEDRPQQARLRIIPPEVGNREAGEYSFTLRVLSPDGTVEYDSVAFSVRVREGRPVEAGALTARADIPVLQGAAGTTLGFEIEVQNDTGAEASFSLAAEPPPGWDVTFREFFGERRVIGAIGVTDGGNQRVRVDVRVPLGTALGQYEIPVAVSGERGEAHETLRANIVGRGELRATTDTERMSLEAPAGGQGLTHLVLKNPGTAELRDIRLVADAPANWVVDFDVPASTVPVVPADGEVAVPMRISPPADAISGDYAVAVRANNAEASTSLDLRVTVTHGPIWGWLGIALVVLVVGGMIGLFLKLGRR